MTINNLLGQIAERLTILKQGKKTFDAPIREAEDEIANLVGIPTDGTKMVKIDTHKVSVVHRPRRTLDLETYDRIVVDLPESARPVRTKLELDVEALKKLAVDDPDNYAVMIQAVTTKPGRPTVKVEVLK